MIDSTVLYSYVVYASTVIQSIEGIKIIFVESLANGTGMQPRPYTADYIGCSYDIQLSC